MFKNSLILVRMSLWPRFKIKRALSTDFPSLLNNDSVKKFLETIGSNASLLHEEDNSVLQLLEQRRGLEKELASLSGMKDEDKDMLQLINDEKSKFVSSIESINQQILLELLPSSEQDRDVLVEVTAGVGGKEAMHFASELFEMYSRYSAFKRWNWEVQETDTPETGGIRHGSAFVSGRGAASSLMQESGVHRVQRVPATEKSGRVHTSTVTVAVLPQPTDVEVVINDKDIKMETKTSSGAGGQHVNKTESCVRITHLPTGIVIENQTDRSQLQNKKLALQRLRSRLYQMELDGFQSKTASSRKEQVGSSMRSEKIRTYNYNQDRITDHRLGVTLHSLPRFLQGGSDLDQLIAQLTDHDKLQQLLRLVEHRLRAKTT